MRRLLVVSVVHHSDDTRIREKLIRTLKTEWEIVYATRPPAPSDPEGLTWLPLDGSRFTRNLRAFRLLLLEDWDVAVVHDPELIPAALVARVVRRKPIVFDVHEDIPGQIRTKEWVRGRRLVAAAAQVALWVAESALVLTLAEPNYRRRFRRSHPVFANYPEVGHLSALAAEPVPGLIAYVGDVTRLRGAEVLVEAAPPGSRVRMVGPVDPALAAHLQGIADDRGVDLQLPGRLPHREAMSRIAPASVAVSPLLDVPNYRDSLPTKLLEYRALGLPVVASDLPGTRIVAGDDPGISLVPPGAVDAWSVALQRALEHTPTRVPPEQTLPAWPSREVAAFYRSLIDRPGIPDPTPGA